MQSQQQRSQEGKVRRMRPNRVRELIGQQVTVVNGWVSCDSVYAAEVLSYAGYDTVTVDLQHGMFGLDWAIGLVQAVSAGPAVPMVRTSGLDPAAIGKLLDAGAYGLICPSIDDAQQCAALVAACRYPPTGKRSYGPARGPAVRRTRLHRPGRRHGTGLGHGRIPYSAGQPRRNPCRAPSRASRASRFSSSSSFNRARSEIFNGGSSPTCSFR